MAESSRELSGLHVKVNIDVSEALVGLKAIQREAKRATAALGELESATQTVHEYSLRDADGIARTYRRTDFGNGYDRITEVTDDN